MDLTALVDVAIGLIFVYLGASLFVTVANEYVGQLLSLRANMLKKNLTELINGDTQVDLNWSHPADADFTAVLILRRTSSPIDDAPAEGDDSYAAGGTIGLSDIVYVGSGTSYTDTGLTNGANYWYEIFSRDACVNHAVGNETGPYKPGPPVPPVTTGEPETVVDGCNLLHGRHRWGQHDDRRAR